MHAEVACGGTRRSLLPHGLQEPAITPPPFLAVPFGKRSDLRGQVPVIFPREVGRRSPRAAAEPLLKARTPSQPPVRRQTAEEPDNRTLPMDGTRLRQPVQRRVVVGHGGSLAAHVPPIYTRHSSGRQRCLASSRALPPLGARRQLFRRTLQSAGF